MATILLIEDDEDIRLNVAEMLALAQHEVITAGNGKEGIEKAQKEHPDLIISDVMMPFMDGFGVLQVLHKDTATRDIPFIFLTSRSETNDLRHAMHLGANDYIVKPFEGSDLLYAVEARLKQAVRKYPVAATEREAGPEIQSKAPLDALIDASDVAEYQKKQIVYKEGSNPRFLYFIRKGKVRTFKSHEDGKDLVMGLYGEGDFIGYAPLFERILHIETAEAIEDSELVLIPRKEFEDMVGRHPEIMKNFIGLLAKNLIEKEEQLLGVAYNTLRKKVASALITLGKKYNMGKEEKYHINMSRDELASIAGTATESLIRTLTEFRHEKLIDMSNGSITIINEHRLQHLLR